MPALTEDFSAVACTVLLGVCGRGTTKKESNNMWNYYALDADEREASGLVNLSRYLPPEDGANRDIGSVQGGYMRFGAKHNDIYPILADMIRWKTNLPGRFD